MSPGAVKGFQKIGTKPMASLAFDKGSPVNSPLSSYLSATPVCDGQKAEKDLCTKFGAV